MASKDKQQPPKDTKDSKEKPQSKDAKQTPNNNNNNQNQQNADQLLRLHVINAKLNASTKENKETWCQVVVGKKNAKTLSHPLTGAKDQPKEIKWDENFAIEYEKKDEDTFIHVEVFTKGLLGNDLLGEFKLKLNEIDPPKPKEDKTEKKDKKKEKKEKEESWAMAKPKEAPLTDKKGNQTGTITLRVRRELKVYGTLVIDIKEAELNETPAGKTKSAKCVVKISSHVQETPGAEGKAHKNLTHFAWKTNNVQIEIDQTNHIFDVFIELWDEHPANPPPQPAAKKDDPKNPEKKQISGLIIAQARITIYDTRSKFSAQLPLLEQTEHKQVGTLKVLAKLKQNKEQKKLSQKETKK